MGRKKPSKEAVYLVGDSAEKRRLMRAGGACVARALNDEVSSVVRVEGRDYYVVGKHPFAAFGVWKYMRYERALVSDKPLTKKEAKALLKRLGVRVRLGKKLGRLPATLRRAVTLAARLTEHTTTLALQMDGTPFGRRENRRLRRFVRKTSDTFAVWVSVTDSRFVPKNRRTVEIRSSLLFSRLRTYRSSVASRRRLTAKIRAQKGSIPPLEAGKIVCVK